MNKVLFLAALSLFAVLGLYAQDSTLAEYKGKYKITSGRVSEVEINGDTASLIVNSAMGSATLVRAEGDVFNMVEYTGTVEFTRNADRKVAGIRISVMGLELEGTKEGAAIRARGLNVRPLSLRSLPNRIKFPSPAAHPAIEGGLMQTAP